MGRMANTSRCELEQALEPKNRGKDGDSLLYFRVANRKLSRFREVKKT